MVALLPSPCWRKQRGRVEGAGGWDLFLVPLRGQEESFFPVLAQMVRAAAAAVQGPTLDLGASGQASGAGRPMGLCDATCELLNVVARIAASLKLVDEPRS